MTKMRHKWIDLGIETTGHPSYEYRCSRCPVVRIKSDFVTFHYAYIDTETKQHVETDRAPKCTPYCVVTSDGVCRPNEQGYCDFCGQKL